MWIYIYVGDVGDVSGSEKKKREAMRTAKCARWKDEYSKLYGWSWVWHQCSSSWMVRQGEAARWV